jgi:hypothetical protein
MDYIIMRWDTIEEAMELIRADSDLGEQLPLAIESAVVLLRFEKIGRWESDSWDWDKPPAYDSGAKKIFEGNADRRKQNALYVRVGGDGRVCQSDTVTSEEIGREKERLRDFGRLVDTLLNDEEAPHRYDKTSSFIRAVFAQRV